MGGRGTPNISGAMEEGVDEGNDGAWEAKGSVTGKRCALLGTEVGAKKGSIWGAGCAGWWAARWQWRHVRAGLAWEGQCAGRGALGARGLLLGRRMGDFFQCEGW